MGGRDGKGKSRLATCLVEFWATQGIPILYFPFEDTAERMVSNLAATHGGYDMFTIRKGRGTDGFMEMHRDCLRSVSRLPIHVCDRSATVERIVTAIAIHKRKYGIRGVVIDGFKDMIPTSGENQTQKENHMIAALVRAAKEYDVSIIPVMHLTKVEDGQWISKQSIKGSGTQTQSARMVLVYQDSGFPAGMDAKFGSMEDNIVLECQKASYGDSGCVVLRPEFHKGRFVEISPMENEETR
jgi:replicative DNA helicase